MSVLSVGHLTMKFGGLVAVNDFNLELEKGEIVGLIGPNGAGKTTVFNMIAGYYVPTEGSILFQGRPIQGRKANQITKAGIARTFQNIRLFSELSVIENVMIGFHCRIRSTFLGATLKLPLYRREEKRMAEGAMKLLEEVDLTDVAHEKATSLPYGKQRRLEIARALATGPALLLLDEPAAGMNPSETQDLLQLILRIRKDYELTVFLIEHDMKFVMEICERLKVLDYGTTIAEGPPTRYRTIPGSSRPTWGRCSVLEVEGLNVHYGGIHALKNVSIRVPEEKVVTLVGANGAGKSTLLRAVSGLVPVSGGKIRYAGRDILGIPSHRIAREGIAMSPEGRRVFVNLSVYENLLMGAYCRDDRKEIDRDIEWIFETFPRLLERRDQPAATLSGGEQQMLALGRALMSRPRLLLLDEPSLGLAPLLIREVFRVITKIHREGTTILLIEQNAMAALHVADYGYVLETGEIVLEGTGKDLLGDERVKKAYLGET